MEEKQMTIILKVPMKVDGYSFTHTRVFSVNKAVFKSFREIILLQFKIPSPDGWWESDYDTELTCHYCEARQFFVAEETLNQLIKLGKYED